MARIEGIRKDKASLISRVLFWVVRRRLGRVSEMVKIAALVPRLHLGWGIFELLLDRSYLVPRRFRKLAAVKTAMLINCPA
jgi:hypothetical protein